AVAGDRLFHPGRIVADHRQRLLARSQEYHATSVGHQNRGAWMRVVGIELFHHHYLWPKLADDFNDSVVDGLDAYCESAGFVAPRSADDPRLADHRSLLSNLQHRVPRHPEPGVNAQNSIPQLRLLGVDHMW